MSQSRPHYHYDLTKLSEFNPAIIYGFEPETNTQGLNGNTHPFEVLTHSINQYEDLFNAYHYAETIIKSIREHGKSIITPHNILLWIKTIHQHISKALAEDQKIPKFAGVYTPLQVTRWHQTGEVETILENKYYAEKLLIQTENNTFILKPTYSSLAVAINNSSRSNVEAMIDCKLNFERKLKELNVNIETANKFLAMMHKYNHNIASETTQQINPSLAILVLTPLKPVVKAWHEGRLTKEEIETIDSLVKICCEPEKIPGLMEHYSHRLAEKWQQCDGSDLRDVAKLCHFAFYELTEIHPFFNANGRTATCLLNTILRSLDHPHQSITMRDPGDRDDAHSSYSQAIEKIDAQPELLEKHIYERINASDEGKCFSDLQLKSIIEYRFTKIKLLHRLHSEFPEFDINPYLCKEMSILFDAVLSNPLKLLSVSTSLSTNNLMASLMLPPLIESINTTLQTLRARKSAPVVALSSVSQRAYSENEIEQMVNALESLTGLTGWKKNANQGFKMWLEADEMDRTTANELVHALNQCDALKATHRTNSIKKTPVIMLEQINPSKLGCIASLSGWQKPHVSEKAKKAV